MVTMSLAAPAPAPLFDPVLAVAVPVAGAVALPAVIMITMIIMIIIIINLIKIIIIFIILITIIMIILIIIIIIITITISSKMIYEFYIQNNNKICM